VDRPCRLAGAFKWRPRDRWIGWSPDLQFDRLHLICNNTRCNNIALALILGRSPDIADMTRHFALHRGEATGATLSPD